MSLSGSNTWYVSSPSCKVIAKKPSLQVWGAGLYTSGMIKLPEAAKAKVDGFNNISGKVVFSSWVEQNIVANNNIMSGLTSGASTGDYNSDRVFNSDRTPHIGLGGSTEKENPQQNLCIRHPLTMPNKGFPSCKLGATDSMPVPKNRDSLRGTFVNGEGDFEKHDTCNLAGLNIDKQKTHVYVCNSGDFTIGGNVVYPNGSYTSLAEIPKVIIYAENNIAIDCAVRQVDAVLIAGGTVSTCNNPDVNGRERSNPLRINGVVISNKMNAGRTYGGATGKNSTVPAEVVNYDSSLYFWGASKADVTKTGKLETVYQTELAPRV